MTNLDIAQAAVSKALAEAAGLDIAIAAVVVDPAGSIIAAARMPGVPPAVLELARRKAATSAAFNVRLSDFVADVKGDDILTGGLTTSPDLILLPGAAPLAGGAIGIGGGHYSQDQQIADAAVATA